MLYNPKLTTLARKFLADICGESGHISYETAMNMIANKKGLFLVVLQRSLRIDGSPHPYSPEEVCQILADLRYPEGVRILAGILIGEDHPIETRLSAVQALAEINSPESRRALLDKLGLLGKRANPMDFVDDTEILAHLAWTILRYRFANAKQALDPLAQLSPIWAAVITGIREGLSAQDALDRSLPQLDRLRDLIFIALNRRLKLVEHQPAGEAQPVLLLVDQRQRNHFFFDKEGKAKLYRDPLNLVNGYFHPLPTRLRFILDGLSRPAYSAENSKFGFIRIMVKNPDARRVYSDVLKSIRRDRSQHRPIVYYLDSNSGRIEACSDLLSWWQGYTRSA